MAKFFLPSVFLLVLCVLINYGNARPQSEVSTAQNQFFTADEGITDDSMSKRRMSLAQYSGEVQSQPQERFYVLRRKKPATSNNLYRPTSQIPIISQSNYQDSISSFSLPILPEEVQSHRRHDADNIGASGYVSLEQAYAINQALESRNSAYQQDNTDYLSNTPIMVENGGNKVFQSNINLPYNPFMQNSAQVRSDHSMSYYPINREEPEPLVPEQGLLQNVLNQYMENLYKPKNPNNYDSSSVSQSSFYHINPSQSHVTDYTARADVFSPLEYKNNKYNNHYSKSGSNSQIYQHQASRKSSTQQEVSTLLSKLKRLYQLKEVFPPPGSYTPYGERTIIMVKYPGMPDKNQGDSPSDLNRDFDINLSPSSLKTFSLKNFLNSGRNSYSGGPVKIKESDFGVIISQNYVLQPDTSLSSHYNTEGDDSSNNPANLVSQLAKALAERNRIINTFSSSPQSKGKDISTKPPFVLVHLETFTKKSNKTTRFGFDDVIEKNYSNGTIIYPTKNNPSILASTKFEFENIDDVEHVFDRTLEGYHHGRMKPIVPLGLTEIKNYLRLMYDVHKDIHEGGRAKVKDLNGLLYSVDRQKMPGSRTMEDWEIARSQDKYNENWLHTSTIGLRSLGEYPIQKYPGRPHIAVEDYSS